MYLKLVLSKYPEPTYPGRTYLSDTWDPHPRSTFEKKQHFSSRLHFCSHFHLSPAVVRGIYDHLGRAEGIYEALQILKGPLPLIFMPLLEGSIRLMDKILHDPKDPKLWELWYIPYYGSCRILSINRTIVTIVLLSEPLRNPYTQTRPQAETHRPEPPCCKT